MKSLVDVKREVKNYKFTDYFNSLKDIQTNIDLSANKRLKVAILRSYTAETIEPLMKLNLILEGFVPEFFWGDFNQFSQEILDESGPLYKFKPDLIILMIRIEELMPQFIDNFGSSQYSAWEKNINRLHDHLIHLVDVLNERTSAQFILQNMALLNEPFWGIFDSQKEDSQKGLLNKLNDALKKSFERKPNSFLWDFESFVTRKGANAICDPKLWFTARNPFKQIAYIDICNDLMRYVLSALGKGKKCVVLDLDNTLWGGIIGEDGMAGIALGHDYPGNCYVEFQRELLKLYHRGIILALNSKNNEADAFEVFDKHPDMVLKRNHIASYQINWTDKSSNLYALAADLNIGLDSMIMIDDNPVECELIRQQCPQCLVIQLPEKPYLIPSVLSGMPELENIRLTEEDKNKGQMYQQQLERKNLEKLATNLGDYLKALDSAIEIKAADKFTVPRISQLTQKTNQFNMTTRRYTEAEIIQFAQSSSSYVFSVSSKDRFGDNGIVGVIILKMAGQEAVIDTFLLSCRVIGRTIEQSIIAFVAEFAKKHGVKTLVGEFQPTPKNKPAADVYEKMNFEKVDENKFFADLDKQQLEYSPYVKHQILI